MRNDRSDGRGQNVFARGLRGRKSYGLREKEEGEKLAMIYTDQTKGVRVREKEIGKYARRR